MSLVVDTFTVITNRLITYLQANTTRITDYNKGSIIRTVLEAVALEFDKQYFQIENVQKASYINTAVGEDLDIKASDYGLLRVPAVAAQGVIRVSRVTPAPVGGISIPAGSVWTTIPQFSAYDAIRFSNPVAAVIAEGDTFVDINIVAVTTGVAGNVPTGAIVVNASNVPDVDAVINSAPTANGDDQESDTELRQRLSLKLKGNNAGSEDSYKSILLANTTAIVSSVSVVGPGEPLMTRDSGVGGKVDIYFKGNLNPTVYQEEFLFDNSVLEYFFSPYIFDPPDYPNNRLVPVVSVASVEDLDVLDTLPSGDYTLVPDASVYANSDRAQDKLTFANMPARDGHRFRVTYTANKTVSDLRALLEPTRPVTADVLVKTGLQQQLDATLKPFYAPGIDEASADAAMLAVLEDYVNSLGLGAVNPNNSLPGLYVTEALRRMAEVKVNGLTAVIGFDKELSTIFFTGIPTTSSVLTLGKDTYFVLNTVTFI